MTKKDFELIANTFMQYFTDLQAGKLESEASVSLFGERLAEALATTNPLFNKRRFLDACGIEYNRRECWTCHEAVGICGHSQPR